MTRKFVSTRVDYMVVERKSDGMYIWRTVEDGQVSRSGGGPCIGPHGASLLAGGFPPGTLASVRTAYEVVVTLPEEKP